MQAYTNTLLEVDSLRRFPGKLLNIPKDSFEPSMRNGGKSENIKKRHLNFQAEFAENIKCTQLPVCVENQNCL